MKDRGFFRKAKRILALVLALTLFWNGWSDLELFVKAAEELTAELERDEETYTGSEITLPGVTVTYSGDASPQILEADTDYTVSWTKESDVVTAAKDAGTYTCTVQGKEQYAQLTATAFFKVARKELTDADVSLSSEEAIYTGEEIAFPQVTVKDGATELAADTDYTVSWSAASIQETGTYTAAISGEGNYSGTVEKSFTVKYGEGGNYTITPSETLTPGVYPEKVTLTAGEGYSISKERNGSFGTSVTFEDSEAGGTVVYLKSDETGWISEKSVDGFTVDTEAPQVSVAGVSDQGKWTQSKTVTLTGSASGLYGGSYYFAKEDILAGKAVVRSGAELAGLTQTAGSGFTVDTETGAGGQTYYVYAIDEAGNVAKTSVSVSKIDTTGPDITLSSEKKDETGIYWLNAEGVEIQLTAEDTASGFTGAEAVSITKDGEPVTFDAEVSEGVLSGTLTLTDVETAAGEYTVEVTDEAGNVSTESFTVKRDTGIPALTHGTPVVDERDTEAYQDENQVYWTGTGSLTIPFTVSDGPGTGDTEQAGYIVEYSASEDMSGAVGLACDGGEGELTLTSLTSTPETWYLRVRDYAGNESAIIAVKTAGDSSRPSISAVAFPQDADVNGWLNGEELGADGGKVQIAVTVQNATSTGIKTFEYTSDGDFDGNNVKTVSAEDCRVEGDTYTFLTEEAYGDADAYDWQVRAVSRVDITGDASHAPGTQIDQRAPEAKGYIQFLTDTKGKNDTTAENAGASGDSWISRIFNALTHTWNKIWGKKEIAFEIYVQDLTSGMKDMTLTYDSDKGQVTLSSEAGSLTKEEGLKAFQRENNDGSAEFIGDTSDKAQGYTVYSGKITVDENQDLAVKDFRITSMTDAAGNEQTTAIVLQPADEDFLFLDAVAPKLTAVTAGTASLTEHERYFYTDSVTVKLAIEERFFTDADEPAVTVLSKDSTQAEFTPEDAQPALEWKASADASHVYEAELTLEKAEGAEKEYQIRLSYQDPSGNLLVNGAGITGVTDGVFTGRTIVIDDRAPELVSYEVNTPSAYSFDGVPVYANDAAGDDLKVTFTLDENASYIDDGGNDSSQAELLAEVYEKNEEGGADTLIASTEADAAEQTLSVAREPEAIADPQTASRQFSYSFGFDGKSTNAENEYYVKISYQDAAGNLLVKSAALELGEAELENGVYTSTGYIIDHVAPRASITFNEAYQVTDSENRTVEGKTPLAAHTSYYGSAQGRITFTVEIDEKYLELRDGSVSDFTLKVNGAEVQADWKKDGRTSTGEYTIDAEGDYILDIFYQDTAGNKLTGGDAVQGGSIADGKYTSPMLILDKTAPVVTRAYTSAPVNTDGSRNYYNADTTLQIQVEDENIRYKELRDELLKMSVTDITGTAVADSAALELAEGIDADGYMRGSWLTELPLTTEANYAIPIAYTDLAGNKAELETTEYVTVDKTAPEKLTFTYSIEDPVNYGPFGWLFSQVKMSITASAEDRTAGLQYIRFTVVDENGKETVKTQEFRPAATGSYQVEIPLETADFKGTVKAEVIDWSVNQTEQTRNHVVESDGRHSSTGSAVITTKTAPSRTVNGTAFYNTDVTLNLTLRDTYSGLRSYQYTGGNTLRGSRNYAEEAGTDLGAAPGQNVTYEFSEDMTLVAAQNNQNDIRVTADFMDNSRHTGHTEQLYNIDITAPEITVEYDLNTPANEKYYNQTRTATVTIRERNFDERDVEFRITNTDGAMPDISGWTHSGSGDDTYHVCRVSFHDDGDYTFTLAFQDMAGNRANYSRVDEFTIDKTLPELTVTWDNNSYLNGYYYDQGRTATIDILEHNFDESLIRVLTTASGDAVSAPGVSGWTRSGDHNIARVTFSHDGDYTFDIEGRDLADNELPAYDLERFVVDMTAPELEIFDIEDRSANNGIVQPGVRYSDTNNDADGTVIEMNGYHNGAVEMNGTRTQTAGGMELKLNDFEHIQAMDDMYTMRAIVYDLAGNSSEDSVTFSVNRFGSVYTFDEATEELAGENGKYYTNEEQDIVVTETNVDTLEFREMTCNLNGELRTMTEGEDYSVSESGTDVSWKQYTYRVQKENFEEEGTYILTIYSEDRATNTSDNNTKGKKLEFVMDKTSPSILISGVENDGQYRESSRAVTLDVQDNVRLADVEVLIDGEKTVYSAAETAEADGKLNLTVGSANHWQELTVTAYDAAGNVQESESIRFLVTANILVQFFMNKPVFYGTFAALAVLAAGGWRIWIAGKKKKENEEE